MKGIMLRNAKVHQDKRRKEKYPEDFIDQAYREAQEHDKKQFFKWLLSERKPWKEYYKTNDDIPTFREWIEQYYE